MNIPYRLANGVNNPPDARKFMANYDWLTSILVGNLTTNGDFETWALGTSFTNPGDSTNILTPWVYRKSGTSAPDANVSRESTNKDTGSYSVKIDVTSAGSANSLIALQENVVSAAYIPGQNLATVWRIKTTTASKVRLKISDGISTAYSEYHTGSGTFETLVAVLTADAAATTVTVQMEMTADFTGQVYLDGATLWITPDSMTTAAKAFLLYSKLYNRFEQLDAIFAPGYGPIVTSPDGLTTWRLGVDNTGNITSTQIT